MSSLWFSFVSGFSVWGLGLGFRVEFAGRVCLVFYGEGPLQVFESLLKSWIS